MVNLQRQMFKIKPGVNRVKKKKPLLYLPQLYYDIE